jgi:hypothetical protein
MSVLLKRGSRSRRQLQRGNKTNTKIQNKSALQWAMDLIRFKKLKEQKKQGL